MRRKLPSPFKSDVWKPWSGILTSAIQAGAMVVSTVAARSNGFDANFAQLVGLWTLRPRVAVATPLWSLLAPCVYHDKHNSNPYKWTFKDMLIAECLLNMVSLPFAVHFLGQREDQSDVCGCSGSGCPILGTDIFYDCMIAVILIGGASFFLLICWLLLHFVTQSRKGDRATEYKRLDGETKGADRMLQILIFGLGSVIMVSACACQWLIWSCKQAISPNIPTYQLTEDNSICDKRW